MAKPTIFGANALLGGADGALDSIDGADLLDKDLCVSVDATSFYAHYLDDDSAAAEDSPLVVAPDDNPGDKRWILKSGVFAGLTLYGGITSTKTNGSLNFSQTITGAGAYGSTVRTICDDNSIMFGAFDDGYVAVANYAGQGVIQVATADLIVAAMTAAKEIKFHTGGRDAGHLRLTIGDAEVTQLGNLLEVKGASGDGITPITLKLHGTTNANWTPGAEFARLDFVSDDTSGDWIVGETRARIAAIAENITGTFTGMAFYTSSNDAILTEQMRIAENGIISFENTLLFKERGDAYADVASYGQDWVMNTVPCVRMFTDDSGVDYALSPQVRIYSTEGPADNLNVTGISTLFLDCSGNDVTIGGLAGGVNGQVLHIARIGAGAFSAILEHAEAEGVQKIYLHAGADEELDTEYGGWVLVCHGGVDWHDCSHAKHV